MTKNQYLGYSKYNKKSRNAGSLGRSKIVPKKRSLKEIRITEAINRLLKLDMVSRVHSIIGGGKEATVLLVETNTGELICAKVFRYFTSTIKKRLQGTKHLLPMDMAMLAAKQEYWNLFEMESSGILVPHPILLQGNILLMEFIAGPESLSPAPLLKDVDLSLYDPEELLYHSIDILADL
ncbi:MAG: RIO1 family regulatory kinase/ATPase domain-containing protein, partial [Candidatus Hodarchaeales archaeon]